jgi:hypothetical protein
MRPALAVITADALILTRCGFISNRYDNQPTTTNLYPIRYLASTLSSCDKHRLISKTFLHIANKPLLTIKQNL